MTADGKRRPLRHFHALSATTIGAFLLFHIANHVAGLRGEGTHIAMMAIGRHVYRFAPVEALLLALLGWQVTSGVVLVIRGWRSRTGIVAWSQAISGLYLALFLCIHLTAVLSGRANGIETDFRFAAEGMHAGLAWFFVPYYALGVIALFTHLGCAAYWWRRARGGGAHAASVAWAPFAGAVLGGLIVASLGGAFYAVHAPVMAG